MSKQLPLKLGKEPLVDAVFELRFRAAAPASSILPGFLYSQLTQRGEKATVNKLPLAQVPDSIRRGDPNLQFAPVVKVDWERFVLLIGDASIAVGCKMPYPGWKDFSPAIQRIVEEIGKIGIVTAVDRYSVKYTDVVPGSDLKRQVSGLNWDVRVGEHKLGAEIATIRLEIPRDDYLHIVLLQTGASIAVNGRETEGVVVDVDTIFKVPQLTVAELTKGFSDRLDTIHMKNKSMFFECLTDDTIKALEPVYA